MADLKQALRAGPDAWAFFVPKIVEQAANAVVASSNESTDGLVAVPGARLARLNREAAGHHCGGALPGPECPPQGSRSSRSSDPNA